MNSLKTMLNPTNPRQSTSIWALLLLAVCLTISAHARSAYTDTDYSAFSAAELDQILAPVALYPDTVLSHILIAATYPLEVVEADRWSQANPGLEGEAAVSAVEGQNWDPSVQALVAFPQILRRMSEDLSWTQRLGDAFLEDEGRVMGAIQNLRYKAYDEGTLNRMEHVRVQREQDAIIIEPAVERVVYVPVYDTRVVYGNWWWPDYPPVYWHYPGVTYVSGFYWGPRIHVGPSFYFSSFHWQRRHVVYVDYRSYHRRPHFYTGRSIVTYHGSRHWRHNPEHRRGVAYRSDRVRSHYGSNRQSYSTSRQQRRGEYSSPRRDQVRERLQQTQERGVRERWQERSGTASSTRRESTRTSSTRRESTTPSRSSTRERWETRTSSPQQQPQHQRPETSRRDRGESQTQTQSFSRTRPAERSEPRRDLSTDRSTRETTRPTTESRRRSTTESPRAVETAPSQEVDTTPSRRSSTRERWQRRSGSDTDSASPPRTRETRSPRAERQGARRDREGSRRGN